MKFSKHYLNTKNSWFFLHLGGRKRLFLTAFGLGGQDRAVQRYHRDDKGGKLGPAMSYADDPRIIEARQEVREMLDFFGYTVGANLSQVVQALSADNNEGILHLARAVGRRFDKLVEEARMQNVHIFDPEKYVVAMPPEGSCYKGPLAKIDVVDIERTIQVQWDRCVGILNKKDRDQMALSANITRESEVNRAADAATSEAIAVEMVA